MEKRATYSSIIDPATFNYLMSQQHLYIREADRLVQEMMEGERKGWEVVELGCGPARLTSRIFTAFNGINLTGIDHDEKFLRYARTSLDSLQRYHQGYEGNRRKPVVLHCADVATYRHPRKVDIFYSQGMHHHIPKGEKTRQYLKSVYRQLKPGGCYILSDEFLSSYRDEQERRLVTIRWHSHIISAALTGDFMGGFKTLAVEEAKTLLDDLAEANDPRSMKTPKQVQLVLRRVKGIDRAAMAGEVRAACSRASRLLMALAVLHTTKRTGDSRYDLSRGDYKVCGDVFRREVSEAGFLVENVKHLGPIDVSGGFSVYLLRKPH